MITTERIKMKTASGVSFQDVTARVAEIVAQSGVSSGSAVVFTRHTTTGIVINEAEERLLQDMTSFLERLAPRSKQYLHDDVELRDCPADEPKNGHSHLKALCLPKSETIPIIDGALALGRWQAVLFVELDDSRERELLVQIRGE